MEFLSIVLVIVASIALGYLFGKPSGIKEGYRTCLKEVLKARCEGRYYLTNSYDDMLENAKYENNHQDDLRSECINLIYGME